jgi:DNA repair ATPase RecN
MLRRANNDYDPDESLQTQETNSIICQIPINYEDYQNKRSSRNSENTSSRTNLHQRNDLKVNVPSMTHEDLDNKSREYLETDTPMFSQNKSIDAQEIQALRNVCSPDSSQDKQFKKIVEMAFE